MTRPRRNNNNISTSRGPFLDIVDNVVVLCKQCFDENDPIMSLTPQEFVPSSYKKIGIENLPSLFVEFVAMEPKVNNTGGKMGNKQNFVEGFYINVYYVASKVTNIDNARDLDLVGNFLYEKLVTNLDLNGYMNGPQCMVISAFPSEDIVFQDPRLKPVDVFNIQLYYEKTSSKQIISR